MAIPNPNPNIADGIKSDNKTYSSNKIESLIHAATELPIPEDGDAGKVVTVNEDLEYDLEAVQAPCIVDDITIASAFTIGAGNSRSEQTSATTIPTHDGYTAACICNCYGYTPYPGNSHKVTCYAYLENGSIKFSVYNPTSDSIDVDIKGSILFIKS